MFECLPNLCKRKSQKDLTQLSEWIEQLKFLIEKLKDDVAMLRFSVRCFSRFS